MSAREVDVPLELTANHYDVFLLYAKSDKETVEKYQDKINKIEDKDMKQDNKFTACTLDDILWKNDLPDSFEEAVKRSTYVFVCLTESFEKDVWANRQSKDALMMTINDPNKQNCLFLVEFSENSFRPSCTTSLKSLEMDDDKLLMSYLLLRQDLKLGRIERQKKEKNNFIEKERKNENISVFNPVGRSEDNVSTASIDFPDIPNGCHRQETGGAMSSYGHRQETGGAMSSYGIKGDYFYTFTSEQFNNAILIDKDLKLGSGGFGPVYKGKSPFNGMEVAIKTENEGSSVNANHGRNKQFTREHDSAFIKHPFVLPVFAVCLKPKYIVYPYMENKDLDSVLIDAPDKIPWYIRVRITYQIGEALQHLHCRTTHKKVIVHRDVKPANILLDEFLNARLADKGLSLFIKEGKEYVTVSEQAGTPGYIDPDVANDKYCPEHDLYSLGMVMFRLLTPRHVTEMRKVLACYKGTYSMIEGLTSDNKMKINELTADIDNEKKIKALTADYERKIEEEIKAVVLKDIWDCEDSTLCGYIKAAVQCFLPPSSRIKLADLCGTLKIMMGNKVPLFEDKFHNTQCVACLANPRVLMSLCWGSSCYFYCRDCLVKKETNPVFCPAHGVSDAQPIGNRNWHVLAIGGYPKPDDDCRIFHRDASWFCNTLMDPRICGVRGENCTLFTIDKEAVYENCDVLKALKAVIKKMNAIEDTSHRKRLFFYYSGHSSEDGNLLLNHHTGNTVTAMDMRKEIHKLVKTDTLVFLDTCYASKHNLSEGLILKSPDSSTILQFSSSNQASKTGYQHNKHNCPFTNAVLNALKGCLPCEKRKNCKDCSRFRGDIESKRFMDLDLMKRIVPHWLETSGEQWPTFKGEHYPGVVVPMAHFCGDQVLHYLVHYEDQVDPYNVVMKDVYLTPVEAQLDKDDETPVDGFIRQVLDNLKKNYGDLPEEFSNPTCYKLCDDKDHTQNTLHDLKEVYNIYGKVTMEFCGNGEAKGETTHHSKSDKSGQSGSHRTPGFRGGKMDPASLIAVVGNAPAAVGNAPAAVGNAPAAVGNAAAAAVGSAAAAVGNAAAAVATDVVFASVVALLSM